MVMFFKKHGFWLLNTMGADAAGFVSYGAGTATESSMMVLPLGYWGEA